VFWIIVAGLGIVGRTSASGRLGSEQEMLASIFFFFTLGRKNDDDDQKGPATYS
jgi:hypothetical protein